MKNTEQKPQVSVLIPVYKSHPEYLRECIESVLSQTFKNFELLLLDDCPEDKTAEQVIKEYDDPRIKYVRNQVNLGIPASRNKLIDMAQGEYLAVMDHDDISLPDRLAKQVAYMEAHPNVGVVSGQVLKIPQNKPSQNPITNHDIKLALMTVSVLSHSCSMIRKSILTAHNIRYEEEFGVAEDYALWCRLLPHTDFYNLPDVILKYRWHESNISKLQKSLMTKKSAIVRAFVQTENPALYSEFKKRAKYECVVRLFGFIPLLKIIRCNTRIKIYLFSVIPLFSSKSSFKLKG